MSNSVQWEAGHELTKEERDSFWETEVIRGFCYSPSFEIPGRGATSHNSVSAFNILENSDLYEVRNSEIEIIDRSCVIFWGNATKQSIDELVAKHIMLLNSKVAFAIKLHAVDSHFAEVAETFRNLRESFWIDFGDLNKAQLEAVDLKLRVADSKYRELCEFLAKPFDPRFRGALEAMLNESDFSSFF